jgi:hypothetical protein
MTIRAESARDFLYHGNRVVNDGLAVIMSNIEDQGHREACRQSTVFRIPLGPKYRKEEAGRIIIEAQGKAQDKSIEIEKSLNTMKREWDKRKRLAEDLHAEIDGAGKITSIFGSVKDHEINLDLKTVIENNWEILFDMIVDEGYWYKGSDLAISRNQVFKRRNYRFSTEASLQYIEANGQMDGYQLADDEADRIARMYYYPLLHANYEEILEKRMRFAEAKATVLGEK